jgi:hypothetical protein
MPVIKISKIADRTKTSSRGKKYNVVEISGTKYGTDEEWSTNIFKNDTERLGMLEEFGPGDVANFKFTQNGNFWDLKEIVEPTEENLEYASKEQGKPSGRASKATTGGKQSGGMSKEEWAEKDRLTNIRIAKAVALKAAVDVGKKTTKTIIAMADELLPYLMDTSVASDSPLQDPEDALDPPTE